MKIFYIVLIVILVAGLISGCCIFNRIGFTYTNADKYSIGSGEISQTVEKVEVDWIAGNVEITATADKKLTFSETANRDISDDKTMRYWLEGTTLHIKYYKSGIYEVMNLSKTLTLTLPVNIKFTDVDINTVSADMMANGITADHMRIDTVSGKINLRNADVSNELRIDTTSGDISGDAINGVEKLNCNTVSGKIDFTNTETNGFDIDTTSGKVSLTLNNTCEYGKVNTVSGDVSIGLPKESDFCIKYNTVSGAFNSEIPSKTNGGKYIFGDGAEVEYKVNTTSGSLQIK